MGSDGGDAGKARGPVIREEIPTTKQARPIEAARSMALIVIAPRGERIGSDDVGGVDCVAKRISWDLRGPAGRCRRVGPGFGGKDGKDQGFDVIRAGMLP